MQYATVTFDRESASPELVAALSELARLAIAHTSLPPVLPIVDEPHEQRESAEQHSAERGTDNQ